MICELCTAEYEPPHNRPAWSKCIDCTLSPTHAMGVRRRMGAAPAYALPAATADRVTFIVPGPPLSINRMYRLAPYGQRRRMHYSPEGVRFKYSIQTHARGAILRLPAQWDITRRYSVEMMAYFDNARADDDNPAKIVRDSLQGILFTDDVQVMDTHTAKAIDKLAPRLVVTVRALQ